MKRYLKTAAALMAMALAGSVWATTAQHEQQRAPIEVFSPSKPPALTPGSRVTYVTAARTTVTSDGSLLVCPTSAVPSTPLQQRCRLPGTKDEQSGWLPLHKFERPGYVMSAVQVNETGGGVSLVVYWAPAPSGTSGK
jgi:hypothetical protein